MKQTFFIKKYKQRQNSAYKHSCSRCKARTGKSHIQHAYQYHIQYHIEHTAKNRKPQPHSRLICSNKIALKQYLKGPYRSYSHHNGSVFHAVRQQSLIGTQHHVDAFVPCKEHCHDNHYQSYIQKHRQRHKPVGLCPLLLSQHLAYESIAAHGKHKR